MNAYPLPANTLPERFPAVRGGFAVSARRMACVLDWALAMQGYPAQGLFFSLFHACAVLVFSNGARYNSMCLLKYTMLEARSNCEYSQPITGLGQLVYH